MPQPLNQSNKLPPLPRGYKLDAPASIPPLPPGYSVDGGSMSRTGGGEQADYAPGFFTRLGQSLGVPTSMEELEAAQPSTAEKLIGPAATAGKMVWNYGKTAAAGIRDAGQEAYQAGQNIAEGGPVGQNLGKAGAGALHGILQATPFIGPSIETAGQDIASGNTMGAAGGLTGVIGQVVAPYAIEKGGAAVRKLRAPLSDTVAQPRGTIPAESASPADLKSYADDHGIPLNAAQATEHNLPRNLQSAGERASVGGTAVRQEIKASQAAVAQHTEKLLDAFAPNTPDLATAGDTMRRGVDSALAKEQATARNNYAAIDQQAGGVGVNLRPLKDTAQQLLKDSSFVRVASSLDQKRAASILRDIGDLPDRASFSDSQQLRSALLDASRTPDLAISTQAQGWIKQLTGAVDGQMAAAARSKPGLEPAFRAANDHWNQLQQDFNHPRSPLFQILQEPDPSKVPQKLVQKGQIGGSPYNAGLLDRYGIDKAPVKWSILNDLMSKDFRLYNKSLGGYGDDFLKSVFTAEELDHIYKTGAIARSVGLNTNPSGTAGVTGAMEDVRKPLRSMLPKGLAARATKSAGFNRWMMKQSTKQPVVPRGSLSLSPMRKSNDDNEAFWKQASQDYRARHGQL